MKFILILLLAALFDCIVSMISTLSAQNKQLPTTEVSNVHFFSVALPFALVPRSSCSVRTAFVKGTVKGTMAQFVPGDSDWSLRGKYCDWDDVMITVGCGVAFLCVRYVLIMLLFRPFGLKVKLMDKASPDELPEKEVELQKFCKYCWHGCCYLVMWLWALYLYLPMPWAFDMDQIWPGYPHAPEGKLVFKKLFILEAAWCDLPSVCYHVIGQKGGDTWIHMLVFLKCVLVSTYPSGVVDSVCVLGCVTSVPAPYLLLETALLDQATAGRRNCWTHTFTRRRTPNLFRYIHGFIESMIHDRKRKDFAMMIIHHVLAVALIVGAYWGNAHRIGITVIVSQVYLPWSVGGRNRSAINVDTRENEG